MEDQQLVMLQDRPTLGDLPDHGEVGKAIGVGAEQLALDVPPRVVGTGANHLMVAVRDQDALAACRPDKQALIDVTTSVAAQGLYVAVIDRDRPVRSVHTRFFNPASGSTRIPQPVAPQDP